MLNEGPSNFLITSPSEPNRTWRRFPVEFVSSVSSTGPEWHGTAINLSRQGCAIHSTTPVQKGDFLQVLIFPGPNQMPIEVEVAQVRWAAKEAFGVEFLKLAPREDLRLQNLLTLLGASPEIITDSPLSMIRAR